MVAPIDYSLPGVQSPFQAFLQAAQVGANISQVQTQREAMLAKAQEAQQAQERQDMINRRLAEIRAKPNRTIDDYAEVAPYMNQGQLAFLTQQFKSQSEVKQQNDLLFLGETLSALRANKPDTAIARLRTQADAEEAISPQRAKAYRDGAAMAEADPAAAELIIGPLLRALPGSDKILDALSKSEGGGVTISAPADKIKAGLVDDKGNPLSGTFFAAPGKKPELVEGTKPKAGFQVLTPENARARGLPTQGFTWQVNESTGEVSSLVKPPQAAIEVKMPPQIGQIPADHRLVYDAAGRPVSMEIIPGSPTSRKLVEQATGKAAQAESTGMAANIVVEELGALRLRIRNQTALDPVTGISGKAAEKVPSSARISAQGSVDTIKANIGFERLNQMRQESPTGGALGNITEQELKFLQGVLGTINLDEKPADTLRKIERLEKIYNDIMRKAAAYPNAAKYGFAPAGAAPAPAPATSPAPAPAGSEFRIRGVRPSGG